jgi:hypothetical protein
MIIQNKITTIFSLAMVLLLSSCGSDSTTNDPVTQTITYIKASNTEDSDEFGTSSAISGDGNTIVVSATGEGSNATGVGGDETNNAAGGAGAVYVFDAQSTPVQQAYIKASNSDGADEFGKSSAISDDGNTIVVSATGERSNATGVGGDETNNAAGGAGAVYVFSKTATAPYWTQTAYIKASNTDSGDEFGTSSAISGDGNTIIVGAIGEDSNATGVGGDETNNAEGFAGAVYVFSKTATAPYWTQTAYIKASNTEADDQFGVSSAISDDGNTIVVGAIGEDSNATGVGGNDTDNSVGTSGAVYVFSKTATAPYWTQTAYIKASNTGSGDRFGSAVAMSGDGGTIAVATYFEDSNATGIGGDETDNTASGSGAVYVFSKTATAPYWTQTAYIKASNSEANDGFGYSVAISGDGDSIIVGADREDGNATGVDGDKTDNNANDSGAVYMFKRIATAPYWVETTYIKASNAETGDEFGFTVASSNDGSAIISSAIAEKSNQVGVGTDGSDNSISDAGAVYLYKLD